MRIVPPISDCLQSSLLLSNFLIWINAFGLLSIAFWFLLDPAQNFQLDLLHFSENAPLLKFSVKLLLGTAFFLLFIGSIGCIGANKLERFLLGSFILLLLFGLLAKIGVALLALLHQTKFPDSQSMSIYLANISQNRYYRDRWVLPLMNTVQYYHQCCGGHNSSDYFGSFWYLTNTERATRSFVPWSCCRQSQEGRAWALHPIDPLCIQYRPLSRAFNDSVNANGCGKPVKGHLDWIVAILLLACSISALADVLALGLALKCLGKVLTFYNAIANL